MRYSQCDPIISRWIKANTKDLSGVADFGAGRFNYTEMIAAPVRIGIEICDAYVRDFETLRPVRKICWDMRRYKELNLSFDGALFVDSLEHVSKSDGCKLLDSLREDCQRILVYVPEGDWPQEDDPWGYENRWQHHRSSWWPNDFSGWHVTRWIDGARKPTFFATWDSKGERDRYFRGDYELRGPHGVWISAS